MYCICNALQTFRQYCGQDGFLLTICAKLRMARSIEEAIIILSFQFVFVLRIIRQVVSYSDDLCLLCKEPETVIK